MPNRTVCAVLKEIRDLDDTKNYSSLLSLIEEVQYLANRMEAALWDQSDLKTMREERVSLKAELKSLESTVKFLKGQNENTISKKQR